MESIDALIERTALSSQTDQRPAACCCGSPDCAFLRYGSNAVADLERDVRAAASVGQALLIRHETYVADAEKERDRMGDTIANLETKNQDLEKQNARVVAENKTLIGQLDRLNASLEESDLHIKDLTATLSSTHQELQKLRGLALRTERLELELEKLEADQAVLQNTIATTEEEKRIANTRWRQSQRTVEELHMQMEVIDREAREDRLRHAAMLARLEKRKAVDDVLHGAKERLSRNNSMAGNEVVSNFVKEILEDNTKLQISMADLQCMLSSSQDESEWLRSQLDLQQVGPPMPPGRSLSDELAEQKHDQTLSQQLHVHHHYHVPSALSSSSTTLASRGRLQAYQRPKRKRQGLASGRSTPVIPETHQIDSAHSRDSSSTSSILALDMTGRSHRWSTHSSQSRSSFAPSSGPSSPTSYAPSTIFEHADDADDTDYTRPTSPESGGLRSPLLRPAHKKGLSDDSFIQPFSLPRESSMQRTDDQSWRGSESMPRASQADVDHSDVPNQDQEDSEMPPAIQRSFKRSPTRPPRLTRNASTSSLLSISGMDIHSTFPSTPSYSTPATLRARPFFASNSSNTGPVLTAATASGSRHFAGGTNDLGQALRQQISTRDMRAVCSKASTGDDSYTPLYDTLGRTVGGWFTGRFSGNRTGASGKPKSSDPPISDSTPTMSNVDVSNKGAGQAKPIVISPVEARKDRRLFPRSPGVNQSGAIPIPPSPKRRNGRAVLATVLDSEALQECLNEDDHMDASMASTIE